MSPIEKAAWAAEQAHNGPPHGLNIDYIAIARAVIASIEPDDAMVEAAAKAIYDDSRWSLSSSWDEALEGRREYYRCTARAALKAGLRALLAEGEKG